MKSALKTFLALALFVALAPSVALAETAEQQVESISIDFGNDFYAAGKSIALSTDAADDAFLTGAIVNVTKNVAHDLFAAGSTVTILAEIGDDVRAVGSVVLLASKIAGDAVIGGGVLNFTENSSVGGAAALAGGVINFDGAVGGDLQLAGDEINFGGTVGGDATIRVGQRINFLDGAKITGKLTYYSKDEIIIPDGLAASVEHKAYKEFDALTEKSLATRAVESLFTLLFAFVTGAVLLAVCGRSSEVFAGKLREKFWWSLLAGVAVLFMPIIVMLLAMTFVGVWLAGILLFLWLAGLLAAGALAGFAIGSLFIPQKKDTKYSQKLIALALGWVIFLVIGFIPGFGHIFQFLIFTFTLGAGILTDLDLYKKMKTSKLL